MADVRDNFFTFCVEREFSFLLRSYSFCAAKQNNLAVVFKNASLTIRICYEERSGYVFFSIRRNGEHDVEILLQDLAFFMSGKIKKYRYGLYVYDLNVLEGCLAELADVIRTELHLMLANDDATWRSAIQFKRHKDAMDLEDMMYGGIRSQASELWDSQDYERFLAAISEIPKARRTSSEQRRIKMAEIKVKAHAGIK